MITDVGIDLDGVMYDFASVFHEYAQNRLNKELSTPQTWDFYHEWGMSDVEFEILLAEGIQKLRLFNLAPPMEKTVEGWNLLKEQGIQLHVLTHRGHLAYEQTVQWLTKHGLIPDSLHFVRTKSILKIISKDECAAIDDYPLYYDQYEKAGILSFLRTQPWNAEKYARRATDLLDFAEKVVTLNNAKKALLELPRAKAFVTPKPSPTVSKNLSAKPMTTNPIHEQSSYVVKYYEYPNKNKPNDYYRNPNE